MDAEFQELKAPGSGLLKPLTSLARCISPSAATHKVTLDTRPNAFTALMQGNNLDKKWAEAEESEKAAVRPQISHLSVISCGPSSEGAW